MATAKLLDQDFGSESEDDVKFNPAPAEESDHEEHQSDHEPRIGGDTDGRRDNRAESEPDAEANQGADEERLDEEEEDEDDEEEDDEEEISVFPELKDSLSHHIHADSS